MKRVIVMKWTKVSLVVPEKQDIDLWYEWMNNINIAKNLLNSFWNIWYREDEEDFYEKQKNDKDNIMFSIYLNNEERVIWNISLNWIDKLSRKSQLWISIFNEDKLSKWYWSEAIRLLLKYAFDLLGLNKVFLDHIEFNERANRAYKKVWFKEVWRYKNHHYVMWKYYDSILMEIFNDNFVAW